MRHVELLGIGKYGFYNDFIINDTENYIAPYMFYMGIVCPYIVLQNKEETVCPAFKNAMKKIYRQSNTDNYRYNQPSHNFEEISDFTPPDFDF